MAKRAQSFDPRQNMTGKNYEVFHYYDRSKRDVDLHHHDFYEIYFFVGGRVEYRVEGKSYTLQNGDLLLISPGVFHQPVVEQDVPYERYVLWIQRNYLSRFVEYGTDLTGCFGPAAVLLQPTSYQRSTLSMLMEMLLKESTGNRFGSELYCHGLFLQLMTEINRMAQRSPQAGGMAEEPELIGRVLAYISDHFNEKITLQTLADKFYVSKYHLSHEFSAQVGTSVYRYIILKRLLSAREQIAAGVAPSEVYQNCGFQDYANFYRAFKTEYGISPKEFAQKN